MTYLRTGLSLTSTLALSVLWIPSAFAQEGSGFTGTLSFSQGFELSDNADLDSATSGSTFTSRTGLGFSATSETRAETLRFQIGTELVGEFGDEVDDDFEIQNSNASLDYERRGANATLSFSASYENIELDDEIETVLGSDTLIIDGGSLEQTSLGAGLQTGIEGPFGLDLQGRYVKRDYTGTTDPDLTDSELISVDALARFRVNPALTARALAGITTEDEDDAAQTETETTYVGVGLEGATGGDLSFTGDILYDRSETSVTNPAPATTTEDGIGVEISVTQERPSGSAGFDIASRIDDEGRRSSASIRQTFDGQTSAFSYSLGVVDQEGDDKLRPRGTLTYTQETPRGGLSASLSQEPSIDDGEIYSNTSISIDFTQDINAVSGWSAGIAYAESNQLNGSDDDDRTTATLAYRRALTEDWSMTTGVEHVRETEAGGPTETSNSIFFNIERDITFGF